MYLYKYHLDCVKESYRANHTVSRVFGILYAMI